MDVMIDLETLGTRPGCAIASIGLAAFEVTGTGIIASRKINVDLRSCGDHGLAIDAGTVLWWLGQDEAARAALRDPKPVSLHSALVDVEAFVLPLQPMAERIWSHGAGFDIPILEAAFDRLRRVPPWRYVHHRDTRTLYDLAGVLPDRAAGTHHDARDDAIAQALAVQMGWKRLLARADFDARFMTRAEVPASQELPCGVAEDAEKHGAEPDSASSAAPRQQSS